MIRLRWALALAAAATLLPAAAPPRKPVRATAPAPRDWTRTVRVTPTGSFVLGSPAARVKIIEYLSFTCPHCADFAMESAAVLKAQMIRSGSTSIEYRPIVRDPVDLSATLLANCAGAAGFVGASDEIFRRQDEWLPRAVDYFRQGAAAHAQEPPLAQLRANAEATGLIALMRARGLPQARIDACFADKAALDRMLTIGEKSGSEITGTPTFFVNGVEADAHNWAALEPVLRAAGAK